MTLNELKSIMQQMPIKGANLINYIIFVLNSIIAYLTTFVPIVNNIGNWVFLTQAKIDELLLISSNIILEADKTYVITEHIDLKGGTFITAGKVTVLGGSSETTSITSTGLTSNTPLITSEYTIALQFLTIKDVHTAISIDGNSNLVALDWTGVNFENVPNIGTINTCDNWVFTKGAFLSAKNLLFEGTHGTIAINNSLLRGDGLSGNIIKISDDAIIQRRFRITYSSVIAFGLTNGIAINEIVTIPNEAFILDVVNFSGSNENQYLPGIHATSNKSLFTKCTNIKNSGDMSSYYMFDNAVVTPITVINTPTKILGTTISGPNTQKFVNTANKAKYVGALLEDFTMTATATVTAGNNNQLSIYIAKNGSIIAESKNTVTANGAGRAENLFAQCVEPLAYDDEIEVYIANNTLTNITVNSLNILIAK